MKRLSLLIPFIALCLPLGGCGFHPVYGTADAEGNSAVAARLNNVAIENIQDRDGQVLRNYLVDRMYGANRPEKPAYKLSVRITNTEENLGILANATATRSLLNMYGDYALTDMSGKTLVKGRAHSVASFDKLDQIYATVASKQDAHQRTLHELSEQIVNRLSLYFSEKE